jgi:hypothetical protein
MALDDFMESEVVVAAAVTAAVCSPPVRRVLRRGLVYGLAGFIIARDKITDVAHNVAHSAKQAAASVNGPARQPEGSSQAKPAVDNPSASPAVPVAG